MELRSNMDSYLRQMPAAPLFPPSSEQNSEFQDLWAAIHDLKATTRQQAAPEAQTLVQTPPDPQINALMNQVSELRAQLDALCVSQAPVPPSALGEDSTGCCPGLEGQPRIICATAISNLTQDVNILFQHFHDCNTNNQDVSELTRELNSRFSPLILLV